VKPDNPDVASFDITIHRSELIPGGNGARIGYCNDLPGRVFLIVPEALE
jgi:hypothetical protein